MKVTGSSLDIGQKADSHHGHRFLRSCGAVSLGWGSWIWGGAMLRPRVQYSFMQEAWGHEHLDLDIKWSEIRHGWFWAVQDMPDSQCQLSHADNSGTVMLRELSLGADLPSRESPEYSFHEAA